MLIIENIAILNGYLKKIGSDSEFPRGRLQPSRWAERAFCGKKKHKANKPIRSMGYCKRSLIRHVRSCRNGYFLSGNKNIATHQSELRYWLRQLPLVYPGGFEPLASGVGVLRSIQLSYEYTFSYCFLIIHCYLHKIKKGCMLSLKKDDELPELGYSI